MSALKIEFNIADKLGLTNSIVHPSMFLNLPWRYLCYFSSNSNATLLRFFTSLSYPSKLSSFNPKQSINNHSIHSSVESIHFQSIKFSRLLKLCRNVEQLKPLKSLLVGHGLIEDNALVEEFVKICFHLGAWDIALSTFRRIENPSLFLQNSTIRCLCNYGFYEETLSIYRSCQVSGCPSDNFTFPFVIKACSGLGAFRTGKEIHCVVLRTGFEGNIVIQTTLVDFYAKNGCMDTAHMLTDRIPKTDLVCWNALIAGYSLNGLDLEAFEVFKQIQLKRLNPNVSTLASIIPVCSRLGLFDIGKSLHGLSVKSGYFSDDSFLVPALVSMYAGYGDLLSSRNLFDSITEKNVTVWNAMISAYTQKQKSFEAFEMFQRVLRAKMQPNLVTFVSIIPSCETIWIGESLHAYIIKHGSENHISVLTVLVSMYAKLGNVNSAKFLFDHMESRNLLSWNSIISGYVHNGLWDAGLTVFSGMQFSRFDPDAISIVSVLSACSKLEAIFLGKSAHAFSVKRGIDSNLNVLNSLLAFYSDCHQVSSSFKIFNKMAIRNSISWNTMISGCVNNGEAKKAASLLHQMQKEGTDLDPVTLISILPSYNEGEILEQGRALHGYAIKIGFASDVSLVNALISMYFNCGDLDAGKLLFEIMTKRSVVSWNAVLTGYRYHNLQNEVLDLFVQMMNENQRPNHVTLINLLPECRSQLQGKSIHAFALKMGITQETPLLTALIVMYARFVNINLCLALFEMGEKREISLWNAIIAAHVQIKCDETAVAFFCKLLQMGLEPDNITVLSLISACVQISSLYLTHSVLSYVIHKGYDKYAAINNALIDLYARCGDISIAKKLFEALLEKDAVSWSVMINAYGLHGDGKAALDLVTQMEFFGMRPDGSTYTSILSACSHASLVEEGRKAFKSMVESGISPRMEHYGCMVDLLGRTGHLNEAYEIVKNLPSKPTVSMLESLLGACRIHGNVELGEKICRMLFEMDPENSGSYVMLYNLYASVGRWADASRVRSDMEGRQLRKLAGFSVLVGNKDHVT